MLHFDLSLMLNATTVDPPARRFAEPQDIFDVDALALREAMSRAASASKDAAHGVAYFRLSGLLDQSQQIVEAFRTAPGDQRTTAQQRKRALRVVAPKLKMRSDILPRKRREIPRGGAEDWHLSDGERFVRWPGAYLDAGSTLGIRQV